jgi:hypothetical protein
VAVISLPTLNKKLITTIIWNKTLFFRHILHLNVISWIWTQIENTQKNSLSKFSAKMSWRCPTDLLFQYKSLLRGNTMYYTIITVLCCDQSDLTASLAHTHKSWLSLFASWANGFCPHSVCVWRSQSSTNHPVWTNSKSNKDLPRFWPPNATRDTIECQ